MDPSVLDPSSPWSNLWIVSSAVFAIIWALAIGAALTAAAAVPYLVARAMAGLSQVRTTRRTYRRLLLAAAAVIILMASTVTGLAYGISTAKHHGLIDRSNPATIGLTAPPTPTNGAVGFAFSHRTKTPSRLC